MTSFQDLKIAKANRNVFYLSFISVCMQQPTLLIFSYVRIALDSASFYKLFKTLFSRLASQETILWFCTSHVQHMGLNIYTINIFDLYNKGTKC